MNLIFFALVGTILLLISLKLEAESSGKGSVEYKEFKKIGLISLSMVWCGVLLIGTMLLIMNGMS